MKKYAFTFSGSQNFCEDITGHDFLLRCMPGTYPFQRSYAHKLAVTPSAALTHVVDVYGNEMYTGTIDKKHSGFSFTASGFVLCSKYLTHEPLDRLYLYPSKLTIPSPEMARLAQTETIPDPWERAQSLCRLTHDRFTLLPASETETAAEAFRTGSGDAQDLAHIFLTLSRLSGVAARFVSGLAIEIPQPHFWAEVYCGGMWRALDPSTGCAAENGYLKIAHGPDYAACAVNRCCFRGRIGNPVQEETFTVQVTEHIVLTRDTVPHA